MLLNRTPMLLAPGMCLLVALSLAVAAPKSASPKKKPEPATEVKGETEDTSGNAADKKSQKSAGLRDERRVNGSPV